ncbi:hypothetical protein [Microbacterium marinilacus]|uniref:Nucleotidyltransferase family protein n=1 Tax=Microbacterium marinilacus TaxID=415209 RepID=A0ABP7BHB2_9MICO|nr:hypothetical protein [Microbacterium marinilacus]MBY0689527.1 hypothetical protein [Microbacterium marinilacus]
MTTAPTPIVMPSMTDAQEQGWHALMDLYYDIPDGWTLVGGQLVHLWCAERGSTIARPTDDIDAVLDVRARPQALWDVTAALHRRGFEPLTTGDNIQHRWVRGEALVDVLIPRHLGARAMARRGVMGGRTIATPGAQKVLNRTERVVVQIGQRTSTILRPSLIGAIIGKSAAYSVDLDDKRERHLGDLVVLGSLLRPSDRREEPLDGRERRLTASAVGAARAKPSTWSYVPNGAQALDRIALLLRDR